MATGFEVALLGCISLNAGLNIIQATSSIRERISRYFRLINCRLVTVSRQHNHNVFYHISKFLNTVSAKLKLRTLLSFGDDKVSHVYYVPDRNTEIKIPTLYGDLWIKVVSLNDYHIDAYEITCMTEDSYAIDKFMVGIYESMRPSITPEELEEHKKLANITAENDEKYTISYRQKQKEEHSETTPIMGLFLGAVLMGTSAYLLSRRRSKH
jgi:hypothetical protein